MDDDLRDGAEPLAGERHQPREVAVPQRRDRRRGRILIDDGEFDAFLAAQKMDAGPVRPTGPLVHIKPNK